MNFYSPNWLYAALVAVVAIVAIYAWAAKIRAKNMQKFASIKLLPSLSKSYSKTKSAIKGAMFTFGIIAIFVALARPQYGYRWEETRAKGVDVIFAIDTSKSMLAEDIAPNRLERAKLAILDLTEMLKNDRIGIVAFSGQAFLQCPLTLDYDAFRMSLEALDTNVIQRGGTNIAAAITEAETAFAKTSAKKILVLISDGEELEASALTKAKDAAKNGITIYTIGVGGEKGEAITITNEFGRTIKLRDENGNIVTSKLNEKVLSEIADATSGFYGKISNQVVEKIVSNGIKTAPQEELASRMKRLAIERFQIPLTIAIVLIALESLIGTRRFFIKNGRKLSAIALLCAFAFSPDVLQAQEAPAPENGSQADLKVEKPAQEKLTKVELQNPTNLAREVFNDGIDLYKKGELQQAKQAFEGAMKLAPDDFKMHAKALYNIANAEYKLAVTPMLDVPTPAEVETKVQQAHNAELAVEKQGLQLLQQGQALLKQEQDMLAKAKTEEEKQSALKNSPLKNQQFQQQLKQAISQCENLPKLPDELDKEIAQTQDAWGKSLENVKYCADLYADSTKLDPTFKNASENLKTANNSIKNIDAQIQILPQLKKETSMLREQINSAKAKIENIKTELKKLVRDDDNKNNQQNQQNNQDNKNNQQNQDKQNKQDKQNNKDKNQDQNKNNQDKNQSQQDKQNDSDKNQNKDNQDNSKSNKDKQNRNDAQDKENRDKSDEQEKSKDEQAVENKQQPKPDNQQNQGQNASDKKDKNTAKSDESAKVQEQKAKQANATQTTENPEQNQDNFRKAEGVMTKAEAKNLLESMKDSEKILPLRGFGEQKNRFEKSYKDW